MSWKKFVINFEHDVCEVRLNT